MNKNTFPFMQPSKTLLYMTKTFHYSYQVFYVSLSKFQCCVVYVREYPIVKLIIDHRRLFPSMLKLTKIQKFRINPVFILSCKVSRLIKDLIKSVQ